VVVAGPHLSAPRRASAHRRCHVRLRALPVVATGGAILVRVKPRAQGLMSGTTASASRAGRRSVIAANASLRLLSLRTSRATSIAFVGGNRSATFARAQSRALLSLMQRPSLSASRIKFGCSSQPQVKVRVGDAEFNAIARVVHNEREPQLAATVKALFSSTAGATAS
jgi:hypothetical protein